MNLDLVQLAERSVAVTGDFLLASATGAAAQAGSAVTELVLARLRTSPAAPTAQALEADPADPQQRADAADALREILDAEPYLVRRLAEELEKMPQNINFQSTGNNNKTFLHSNVSAAGKSRVSFGDTTTENNVTKKGGAFWGAVAAAVVVLGGGATLVITQNGPDDNPKQQAEKVAIDFIRAAFTNDMETVCGLASRKAVESNGGLAICSDEKQLSEQKGKPVPEEGRAHAEQWKASSVELPSDNTARVTATNGQKGMIVHLTREDGGWRVAESEGGQ